MEKLVIKVWPEWLSSPLWGWGDDPTAAGEQIDLQDLPISSDLRDRIEQWDRQLQATFRHDDPESSGWDPLGDRQEIEAYDAEGEEISKVLSEECGPMYEVWYYNYCASFVSCEDPWPLSKYCDGRKLIT